MVRERMRVKSNESKCTESVYKFTQTTWYYHFVCVQIRRTCDDKGQESCLLYSNFDSRLKLRHLCCCNFRRRCCLYYWTGFGVAVAAVENTFVAAVA